MGRQTALVIHVVQVVDMDVHRSLSSNCAPRFKPTTTLMMSVRIKALHVLSITHVRRVVVRNGCDGDPSVGIRVGKSDDGVVSVARRASVSGL